MSADLEWMRTEGMRIKALCENYERMPAPERDRLDALLGYYRSPSYAIDLSRRVHELAKKYSTLSKWTHKSMASYLSDLDPWSGWYLDLVISREEAKLAAPQRRVHTQEFRLPTELDASWPRPRDGA